MGQSRLKGLIAAAVVAIGMAIWSGSAFGQGDEAANLAKQAEEFVKADKFVEARAKYIEALRLTDGSRIESQYQNFETRVSKRIEGLLKEASALYDSGQYPEAAAKLADARALREGDPTVLYNIALVKMKMGERVDAVALLGEAADGLTDTDDRGRLRQLRTEWETGQTSPTLGPNETADAVHDINELILQGDNAADTCRRLRALTGSVSRAPGVLFNLAKCAEDEGNLEEASRLLDQYLQTAPEAVDIAESRARDRDLRLILSLEKRGGPELLKHYTDADRDTRSGRYRHAVETLEAAEKLAPDIAETQLRLARLFQGLGNVSAARSRYDKFLQLESDSRSRVLVEAERDALDRRVKQYQEILAPASDRLRGLLDRFVVQGRPMGLPATQQELQMIAEELQRAAVMVPLASDVNLALGQVYLLSGNYNAARKSFTAAADTGMPIWFYAKVKGPNAAWKDVMSKVEISRKGILVVGLAKQEKKKWVPFGTGTHGDALGGFLVAYEAPPGDTTSFPWDASSISSLETFEATIQVTRPIGKKTERMTIQPLGIGRKPPSTGPAARRFSNTYTKLFRDFGDIRVELGLERMTKGEKFMLALEVVNAATSAWNLSSALGGTTTGFQRFAATMQSITWATATLQSSLEAQRRMFREMDFKVVAIDAPKPEFRTELFK